MHTRDGQSHAGLHPLTAVPPHQGTLLLVEVRHRAGHQLAQVRSLYLRQGVGDDGNLRDRLSDGATAGGGGGRTAIAASGLTPIAWQSERAWLHATPPSTKGSERKERKKSTLMTARSLHGVRICLA